MKRLKKLIILTLAAVFLMGVGGTVFAENIAAAKEEAVFGLLNADGSVIAVYVVNTVNGGNFVDYGDYSKVINMTNADAINQNGDKISVNSGAGRFYYQGTLKKAELPWIVEIKYTIDGEEISAASLAGKSGALEIAVIIKSNGNITSDFFDNFLLQTTLTLDTDICTDIVSEGATLANAGKNKVITHTVMPGNTAELKISASVRDFEMAGIEFSAVPMSMAFNLPDIEGLKEDLMTLADGIGALGDGAQGLKSGLAELQNGAQALGGGAAQFGAGLGDLNKSSGKLLEASLAVKNALAQMSAATLANAGELSFDELKKLPAGLRQLAGGLDTLSAGMDELQQGYAAAYGLLKNAIDSIPDAEIDPSALYAAVYGNAELTAALDGLMAYYAAAKSVKGVYGAVAQAFDSVEGSLATFSASVGVVSAQLNAIAAGLEQSLGEFDSFADGINQLSAGLAELSDNYAKLHTGLIGYMGGVSGLAEGYGEISGGIDALTDGIGQAASGAVQLAEGSAKLSGALTDLPELMESEIAKLMAQYDKSDFVPRSFVSDKNTDVKAVQFAFKTAPVEREAADVAPPIVAKKLNFWQKLLRLFGLYR